MQCFCGDDEEAVADGEAGWIWSRDAGRPSRASYWSPNLASNGINGTPQPQSFFGLSFKKRWKELEGPNASMSMSSLDAGNSVCPGSYQPSSMPLPSTSVPPELYSCFLEATAASSLNQFDASSYSSGTVSSGISSWHETLARSRSSSSSRGSRPTSAPRRERSPGQRSRVPRRKSPGTPIPSRRVRSPSLHRRFFHSARGKSVDQSLLFTSLNINGTSNQSSNQQPLSLNSHQSAGPSKRLSRRKRKIRQRDLRSDESQDELHNIRSATKTTVLSDRKTTRPLESTDDGSSPSTSRRSRSSIRKVKQSKDNKQSFEAAVARAKSLGRLSNTRHDIRPLPPSRRRQQQHRPPLLPVRTPHPFVMDIEDRNNNTIYSSINNFIYYIKQYLFKFFSKFTFTITYSIV